MIVIWLTLSIKIVGPDEMAVRLIFGRPDKAWFLVPAGFVDSGFCFVLRLPGCRLVRYPKKMYNFDYRAREVVTQAGEYKGKYYSSQVLKVDSVAYMNFPREKRKRSDGETVDDGITHPLIKILRAGVPIEEEKLKDWTEEAVVGAIRVAFGKMTWKQAVEDMKAINEEAEKIFTAENSALIRAGFSKKGIRLVIAEIKLPPELEKALPQPDTARLAAEAAEYVAERVAIETIGAIIEMMARSRGKSKEEIQELIASGRYERREFLELSKDLIKRRMAIDGKSFVDIRVEGANGIEKSLLNLIAAWKRMPSGATEVRKIEKEEIRKKPEEMTHEELVRISREGGF